MVHLVKQNDNTSAYVKECIVNTEEDLSKVSIDNMYPGSTCIVANEKACEKYTLTGEGKWISKDKKIIIPIKTEDTPKVGLIRQDDRTSAYVKEFIADTFADMGTIKLDGVYPGSLCIIAENSEQYILTVDKIWVKYTINSGGGAVGPKGDKGDKGDDGQQGEEGLSAYEVAQKNGFTGTEKEWLDSLRAESIWEEL